jgi:uncharacterized membrane protein required for colicin V production
MLFGLISIGGLDFNGFDVVVLILLGISLLYAASRGFAREVTSILAITFAATITLFVWGQFRFAAHDFISPTWLADGALVLGVGALTYLIVLSLLSKITKSIKGKEVGFIDRILGAAFGVARGLIIAALGVMVLNSQHRASAEAQEFRDYIEDNNIPPEIIEKMPKSMREQLDAQPEPLPTLLEDSTFYPLLDNIGSAIRALPFAKMRSYADRIKDGEFGALAEELQQ